MQNGLNKRISAPFGNTRNDIYIYTLCDMLHRPYKEAVTYKNIVNGFSAYGVWCAQKGGVGDDVIRANDKQHGRIWW